MKPETQLIALLEWMEWKWFAIQDKKGKTFHQFVQPGAFSKNQIRRYSAIEVAREDIPSDAEILPLGLPPLTLDLMHEAEKTLSEDEYDNFGQHLMKATGASATYSVQDCPKIVSATAAQRTEALLKTVGKWEP